MEATERSIDELRKQHAVWDHFVALTERPRASQHEEAAVQYVIDFANRNGWTYRIDKIPDANNPNRVGNISVDTPATPGYETVPLLVIQNHLDMVTNKHDFAADPMKLRRVARHQVNDDGTPRTINALMATDTTLGADNGIGVAAALAFCEDSKAVHGPIKLLLTVDEEEDLSGAENLSGDFHGIRDAKYMFSLDGNRVRRIAVQCAGVQYMDVDLPIEREELAVQEFGQMFDISIDGMPGGHSGFVIHEKERGNAIMDLARMLAQHLPQGSRMLSITGGKAGNAIAPNAVARVLIPHEGLTGDWRKGIEEFATQLKERTAAFRKETDPECVVKAEQLPVVEKRVQAMSTVSHQKTLDLLEDIPHGVGTMSDSPGVPNSSITFGLLNEDAKTKNLKLTLLIRSAIEQQREELHSKILDVFEPHTSSIETKAAMPGWAESDTSVLLEISDEAHRQMSGNEKPLERFREHGHLEIADILAQMADGAGAVAFGADIYDEHSGRESVDEDSVEKFYALFSKAVELYSIRGKEGRLAA